MPTTDEIRSVIDRYVATINQRDPASIAVLFTADATQADPASQPPNVGRKAITEFFVNGVAASEDWTFEATNVHVCASTVAFDFAITIRLGEGSMTVNGIEVFETDNAGLIASARAYWDDTDVSFV